MMEIEKKRRSSEIYVKWKVQRQELEKQVEKGSKEVEESWKVQGQWGAGQLSPLFSFCFFLFLLFVFLCLSVFFFRLVY